MPDALDDQVTLSRLLNAARALLFDFDGPVTDLFRGASTAAVAAEIKETVRRHWGTLDQDVEECDDSHGVLQRVRDMADRPAAQPGERTALDLAEAIVTRGELDTEGFGARHGNARIIGWDRRSPSRSTQELAEHHMEWHRNLWDTLEYIKPEMPVLDSPRWVPPEERPAR